MPTTNFGPPKGPPKKAPSASKFLPFITESSSPLMVYKALVQRAKGVSNQDLCILFSAILNLGVKAIKEKTKNVESTDEIFKHLIAVYPQFRPSISTLKYWEFVLRNYDINKIETNAEYSIAETTILFTCIAKHKKEFLPEIGFDLDTELFDKFSQDSNKIKIKDFGLDFSNTENKIAFESLEELKAYVAYRLTIKDSAISFYPVINKHSATKYAEKIASPYPNEKQTTTNSSEENYFNQKNKYYDWKANKWIDENSSQELPPWKYDGKSIPPFQKDDRSDENDSSS